MHPITPYARSAYAMGWAASGGPMTNRVKAGCIAAIEHAIEHADDPDILEVTLRLGHLEGVWAQIFTRRAQLYADNIAKVTDAWKRLVAPVDLTNLVRSIRHQAGLTENDRDQITAAFATTLVLNQLMSLMATKPWQQLKQLITELLSTGLAEGQASAMALLADQVDAVGFNFDKAYADALKQFGTDNPFLVDVDNWLARLANEVAKAVGNTIADSAADEDEFDDTEGDAEELLTNPTRPLTYIIDDLTHLMISAGIMWFYRTNGVQNIWFITAGDEVVCPNCEEAEAESPYAYTEVPTPPLHPNCRCSLYTDDTLPEDLIADYLD